MILTLDGTRFTGFSNYAINLLYDSVASTFSFSALRDFAPAPFGFQTCTIEDDAGNLLITGTVLSSNFVATRKEQLITINGYSLPGILEDCQIPPSIYPLQSDKLTLRQIIDKVTAPFGISYVVDSIVSAEFDLTYEKSNADPGESVKGYINRLVSQKGIILTHNSNGALVFTKLQAEALSPVLSFAEGNPGIFEISLQTNGQAMHSEITVMRQAGAKSTRALQSTIANPYCPITRSKVKILNSDSGDLLDVDKAARNELGAELAGAISLTIKTTAFVMPGNLIRVKSQTLRISEYTEFFVQSCQISGDVNGEKYTLTCVLKEAYTTDEVNNIFL